MANYSSQAVLCSLGTTAIGGNGAGIYQIKGKISLPKQSEGSSASSQLIVTINVSGGSPIYTGMPGADAFQTGATLSSTDVFNVVLTSSNPIDQALNAFKATVELISLS
jgi:hypothetical protein